MSQEWMIDVLTDLRQFAQQNGLMGLAEQLDDTILIAATELKTANQDRTSLGNSTKQDRGVSGTLASGDNI